MPGSQVPRQDLHLATTGGERAHRDSHRGARWAIADSVVEQVGYAAAEVISVAPSGDRTGRVQADPSLGPQGTKARHLPGSYLLEVNRGRGLRSAVAQPGDTEEVVDEPPETAGLAHQGGLELFTPRPGWVLP